MLGSEIGGYDLYSVNGVFCYDLIDFMQSPAEFHFICQLQSRFTTPKKEKRNSCARTQETTQLQAF